MGHGLEFPLDGHSWSESIVERLLETINRNDDFTHAVNNMLRVVGEGAEAGRCYVYRYLDDDFSGAVKEFEWSHSATVDILPDPAHCDALDKQQVLFLDYPSGWKRILLAIQTSDHRAYGFVGMDFPQNRQECHAGLTHVMKSFAQLFRLAHARTRQHAELLESLSLQRQIMDNIALPILLLDLDYRVMAANPNKKVNVEMPLEQLLGTHCYDNVCKYGAPPDFCATQETMRTQQPARKEFTFGEKRLVSTSQPIFDLNGKMQYVLSLDFDITEVTRQKEELKAAMEQAQAANRAKSNFLATVSHELRTPLNVVIGFAELLRNGGVDEEKQQEYLRSISFAGNALLGLINDVLDISNLEADTTQITPTQNDVAELIRQTAAIFAMKASEKRIELSISTDNIGHRMLYMDNLRLRQILLNLLGNAIKFTSEGRVAVDASFTEEDNERGTLVVRVSDTGIGIAPENQERIFEPFIHDSIIRGKWMYEGSGLGLTITRKLLDKMGGSIRLESEPGKGSTFIIQFNLVQYEAAPAVPPSSHTSPEHAGDDTRKDRKIRVLLVDDVPLNLKVLNAMLKLLHVDGISTYSAEAALDKLRTDGPFDLVLTDLWMPGQSGADLARIIREEKIADIPVVAVTADTQLSAEDRQLFTDILYKPITLDPLREMLKNLLPQSMQ